jgi:hypothetical protein
VCRARYAVLDGKVIVMCRLAITGMAAKLAEYIAAADGQGPQGESQWSRSDARDRKEGSDRRGTAPFRADGRWLVYLATFRRKNRGSEGRDQARRQREARRGGGAKRPRLAREVDYLWSDCSSITRPMLMRLSATTPSPTHRFIPVLPL